MKSRTVVIACTLFVGCTGGLMGASLCLNPLRARTPNSLGLAGATSRRRGQAWKFLMGRNTKFLSYLQLRGEIRRTLDRSWVVDGVDQWGSHRTVLGGADFNRSWVADRTPNQQKIVTIRKMAFQVCGSVVAEEAGAPAAQRVVFSRVNPGQNINIEAQGVQNQVRDLWQRFFLEQATQGQLDASLAGLLEAQTLANSRTAWQSLCAAYITSTRFLTY